MGKGSDWVSIQEHNRTQNQEKITGTSLCIKLSLLTLKQPTSFNDKDDQLKFTPISEFLFLTK